MQHHGQVCGRWGREVEVATGKAWTGRLGVWAFFIGDEECFLKQRCNKITSTLRKLAGVEITNRRPTDWTGPAGRLGLVPTYFVLNRFFHDGD